MTILPFVAGMFLAYANGANDNLKGVATLMGSRTIGPRGALAWGTLTTLLGSLAALLLSGRLLAAFSGKGIVPEALVGDPLFLVATGTAAALVVLLATVRGLPVSTTHALVGGLAGAGVASAGMVGVEWSRLATMFALPLLLSPLAAAVLVMIVWPILNSARSMLGVDDASCVCVGQKVVALAPVAPQGGARVTSIVRVLTAQIGARGTCDDARSVATRWVDLPLRRLVDGLHFLSAGAVGFARGLNDTPKIAAILLAGGAPGAAPGATPGATGALISIGAGMAVGALLQARRVGHTMSFDITPMNAGQGLTANVATSALVLGASRLGMPVSTTHVSVGALFGLGASTGGLVHRTFARILAAWVITLPAAFVVAMVIHWLAR